MYSERIQKRLKMHRIIERLMFFPMLRNLSESSWDDHWEYPLNAPAPRNNLPARSILHHPLEPLCCPLTATRPPRYTAKVIQPTFVAPTLLAAT